MALAVYLSNSSFILSPESPTADRVIGGWENVTQLNDKLNYLSRTTAPSAACAAARRATGTRNGEQLT